MKGRRKPDPTAVENRLDSSFLGAHDDASSVTHCLSQATGASLTTSRHRCRRPRRTRLGAWSSGAHRATSTPRRHKPPTPSGTAPPRRTIAPPSWPRLHSARPLLVRARPRGKPRRYRRTNCFTWNPPWSSGACRGTRTGTDTPPMPPPPRQSHRHPRRNPPR